MKEAKCRFCGTPLGKCFLDFGVTPFSNSYVKTENLRLREIFFPLQVFVCQNCYLVQIEAFETPEAIFADYAYFSSYSDTWLIHNKKYTEMMISRFGYGKNSHIVEIASNDGYLLQYFKEKDIPVLGIEPAANVAKAAEKKGIPTLNEFFGVKLAQKLVSRGKHADLIIGNNVLAHVPDINDFISGMKILLHPQGIITMEFPHLLRLMEENQFDTIYHEHFSYISFIAAKNMFEHHGLAIFDVDELPTHGGSLRIYARHADDKSRPVKKKVAQLLIREEKSGLKNMTTYDNFAEKTKEIKRNILKLLIKIKSKNKTIAGYGAAAKGNTLLNYCGIRTDFLDYVADRSPHKQGLFLPGTHIRIESPDKIKKTRPDYVLILPWNIKDEIIEQMAYIKEWGGKFIIPIPRARVINR